MEVTINKSRSDYSSTRIKYLNTTCTLFIESLDLSIANEDGAFTQIGAMAIEDQGVLDE